VAVPGTSVQPFPLFCIVLILNADDVERPTLSLTWMTKENSPATVGVPEMVPLEGDNARLVGSWPLKTDQA